MPRRERIFQRRLRLRNAVPLHRGRSPASQNAFERRGGDLFPDAFLVQPAVERRSLVFSFHRIVLFFQARDQCGVRREKSLDLKIPRRIGTLYDNRVALEYRPLGPLKLRKSDVVVDNGPYLARLGPYEVPLSL